VDDIFETVDGGNFSLPTLVGASDNDNLVVLSDRDRTDLKSTLEPSATRIEGED
jgi:hypothetical protein